MQHEHFSNLLRSRSGRSHVTLPVPTRLLQTDIHSFLGILRFCLLGPMSLSFGCHCIRCINHRREHSQENESHTLIGLFPRKECMSVWSSRVGKGSVTWLRPERLRRRLTFLRISGGSSVGHPIRASVPFFCQSRAKCFPALCTGCMLLSVSPDWFVALFVVSWLAKCNCASFELAWWSFAAFVTRSLAWQKSRTTWTVWE